MSADCPVCLVDGILQCKDHAPQSVMSDRLDTIWDAIRVFHCSMCKRSGSMWSTAGSDPTDGWNNETYWGADPKFDISGLKTDDPFLMTPHVERLCEAHYLMSRFSIMGYDCTRECRVNVYRGWWDRRTVGADPDPLTDEFIEEMETEEDSHYFEMGRTYANFDSAKLYGVKCRHCGSELSPPEDQ